MSWWASCVGRRERRESVITKLTYEPTVEDPGVFRLGVAIFFGNMDALKLGSRSRNQRPGGVAIRVGGCFPDINLEVLGDLCVLAGTVDCSRPLTDQVSSDLFAQLEGEVWSGGAHIGELRLMNGDELWLGPIC